MRKERFDYLSHDDFDDLDNEYSERLSYKSKSQMHILHRILFVVIVSQALQFLRCRS